MMKLSSFSTILIVLIGLAVFVVYQSEQRANIAGIKAQKQIDRKNDTQELQTCDTVYEDFYNKLLDVTQNYEPLRANIYRCFNENPDGLARVLLKTDGASAEGASVFLYQISKVYPEKTFRMIQSISDEQHKSKLMSSLASESVYWCDFSLFRHQQSSHWDGDINLMLKQVTGLMQGRFNREYSECEKLVQRISIP